MIKNYMEEVVDVLLPDLLKEYNNICTCEKCIEDIKAIALNRLKPCYVVTRKGLLYTKIDEMAIQFKADVFNELTKAIISVTNNPKH
jgi:competence protein ComFB